MIRVFAASMFLVSLVGTANAQSSDVSITSFDPAQAVAPMSTVEGPGIKVGSGTVLHPVFGLETGVVSNVFYEEANTQPAGVLRLLAQIGAGSLSSQRLSPSGDEGEKTEGDFQYRASLRASYDFLLSNDSTVTETGGLGLGASIRGLVNPMGKWQFGFDENFTRLIRAANFETDANTNRDINTLALNLFYKPQGSSVSGMLYYNNTIDIFERSEQRFADRLQHRFGIRPEWRWLPQTTVYLDVSQGIYSGLGNSTKTSSYPLTALTGIATLLSLKTTLNFQAGYTNGFYSRDESYSAAVIGAALGYRYSPLGRIAVTYDLQYQDSVNANFYRDHVLRVWLQQAIRPLVFMIQPEVHLRRYSGITLVAGPRTRDDVIVSVISGVHYNFRNWIAATLNYHFTAVETNYRYMTDGIVDDPSFVRHELLLGLRVAM
jgi:hypothetical protein